jgi:hypothetical protein
MSSHRLIATHLFCRMEGSIATGELQPHKICAASSRHNAHNGAALEPRKGWAAKPPGDGFHPLYGSATVGRQPREPLSGTISFLSQSPA